MRSLVNLEVGDYVGFRTMEPDAVWQHGTVIAVEPPYVVQIVGEDGRAHRLSQDIWHSRYAEIVKAVRPDATAADDPDNKNTPSPTKRRPIWNWRGLFRRSKKRRYLNEATA